jgi:fido (protein-threonine AMPylation protein)
VIELETYEKLILHRNFRLILKASLSSSFDNNHMQMIHENLCRGLEHRDAEFKSGEIRAAVSGTKLLGAEVNNIASHLMVSIDKHHVAERTAYVMLRIENMQPFHSFNSMVGKLYSHNLAQTAGFNINWPGMDKTDLEKAIESAKQGNQQGLVKQIESNLHPMYEPEKKTNIVDKMGSNFKDRVADFKSQRAEEVAAKSQGTRVGM